MKKLERSIIQINGITMKSEMSNTEYLCIKILPPEGEVHITAPVLLPVYAIKSILVSKLEWIIEQQSHIQLSVNDGKRIKSFYIHMKNSNNSNIIGRTNE